MRRDAQEAGEAGPVGGLDLSQVSRAAHLPTTTAEGHRLFRATEPLRSKLPALGVSLVAGFAHDLVLAIGTIVALAIIVGIYVLHVRLHRRTVRGWEAEMNARLLGERRRRAEERRRRKERG